MASHYEAPIRKPLVTGNKSYHDVSIDIVNAVEGKANNQWWIVFSIALIMFLWGLYCIVYTISTGIGTWGLNKTVGWAWDITNLESVMLEPLFLLYFYCLDKSGEWPLTDLQRQ